MSRQKVNGNGIRAAGNPDEEPNLSRFPTCPPSNRIVSQMEESLAPSETNQPSTAAGDRMDTPPSKPYSRIVNKSGSKDSDDGEDDGSFESPEKATKTTGRKSSSSTGMNSFPLKFQRLLDKFDAEGDTDVISWLSHGRAFLVRDPDRFTKEIMPKYFNQTKYSSFQRQLHMYDFLRITAGPDKGAYHHPSFQRGKPHLCYQMTRTRVKGHGCRRPGNPDAEPDLYAMQSLPHIPRGTVIEIPMTGNADEDADATMSEEET